MPFAHIHPAATPRVSSDKPSSSCAFLSHTHTKSSIPLNTPVINILGAKFPMNSMFANLPININTIQPPLKKVPNNTFRILCSEALRPNELPKDGIVNYSLLPFMALTTFTGRLCCGKGKVCKDPDTAELLNSDANLVTEVAGQVAYNASGFTKVKV